MRLRWFMIDIEKIRCLDIEIIDSFFEECYCAKRYVMIVLIVKQSIINKVGKIKSSYSYMSILRLRYYLLNKAFF